MIVDASREDSAQRPPVDKRSRFRVAIFAILCATCLLVASGYVMLARARAESAAQQAMAQPVAAPSTLQTMSSQPHLVFLQTQGDAYRRVGLVGLGETDGSRSLTTLRCQRVHMAAGHGLCLGLTSRGGAFTFDADFQPQHMLTISGAPSRVRVSPDGRYGAMTVFVRGHSYASTSFSTQTTIVDMATGTMLGADPEDVSDGRLGLERFAVSRDGARFEAEDHNFWGVTFARDSNRFYATLGSGGKTYLIEGNVEREEARILTENVECPSLSPDGTRLAFKKRVGGGGISPVVWQLRLLDLATLTETPLAETRNVDDQVEWLDDRHILYSLLDDESSVSIRPDIWQLAVDGGAPQVMATGAMSPAVVR
jgi:hypothetical protein